MRRVLKPGGTLLATVPFSARVHYAPYDVHRFTKYALTEMFAGFEAVTIEERGNDLAVIANKLSSWRSHDPTIALVAGALATTRLHPAGSSGVSARCAYRARLRSGIEDDTVATDCRDKGALIAFRDVCHLAPADDQPAVALISQRSR